MGGVRYGVRMQKKLALQKSAMVVSRRMPKTIRASRGMPHSAYFTCAKTARNRQKRELGRLLKDDSVVAAAAAVSDVPLTSLLDVNSVVRSVSFVGRKLKMGLLEGEIELPMNGYELAGVMSHYTSDRIGRELQIRLEESMSEENFSESTIRGRDQFLRELINVMTDPILRLQYDEETYYGRGEWYISRDKLSGVLAILLEDSKINDVIEIGLKHVKKIRNIEMRKDAALAIAIAFFEKAREASASDISSISDACEYLNYVLNTIDEFSLDSETSKELNYETENLLKSLMPKSVLEKLSKPIIPQFAYARTEAIENLKVILWDDKFSNSFKRLDSKFAFQDQALSLMTPIEQIQLFESRPERAGLNAEEVYDASLSYVAAGIIQKKPSLVKRGGILLEELANEDEPGPRAMARAVELSMERGACAMLLGDIDESISLMLDPRRANPEIKKYMYSMKSVRGIQNPDDKNAYGACQLVDQWINVTLLGMFRGTQTVFFSLDDWFKSGGVSRYLKYYEFVSFYFKQNSVSAIPRAIMYATYTLSSLLISWIRDIPQLLASYRARLESDFILATGLGITAPSSESDIVKDWKQEPESTTMRGLIVKVFGILYVGIRSAKNLFNSFYSPYYARRIYTSGAIIIAMGSLLLYSMTRSSGSPFGLSSQMRPIAEIVGYSESAKTMTPTILSTRQVASIVRNWQVQKSNALGDKHDYSKLKEILCGDMLASWLQKAQVIKERGIWWQYDLKSLAIESITQTARNRVVAIVKLEETARLHGVPHASRPSTYRSQYRARYAIVLKNGTWKIESGSVLADE